MKKDKNKKFRFRLPKITPLNLILMILIPIILFFVIAIPIVYVNEYNAQKVTPFESELKDINSKNITYGDKDTIKDFNFKLWCTNYNNEKGSATFRAIAYENENTSSIMNLSNRISIKVGMYSNWIKVSQTASNRDRYIATGPKTAQNSSRYYAEFTINSLPTLPKKGGLPFIKVSDIPAYAYVKYTTTINGTETTHHYVLKYEYKDYVISSMTLSDYRSKEITVESNNIRWRYTKDQSWTTYMSTDALVGIELKTTDTHIQWKRKSDTTWINLKAFTDLTNYTEGMTVQTEISGSQVRYKLGEDDWKNLCSVNSLQSLDSGNVRISNGYIQWKRTEKEEWNNLKALVDLEDYTEEKKVEVRVYNGNVQYNLASTGWKTIEEVNNLIGVKLQFDQERNIQWRCADEKNWKYLMSNGNKVNEKDLDTNPVIIGPTSGGM